MTRPVCQISRDRFRFRNHLIVRHTQTDQPDSLSFCAGDKAARHQIVFRLGHAAQQRPDDSRVVTRRYAHAHVPIGQTRTRR